ncbi:uncharacterized protein V2V93DRAFT_378507 [Kockiozyma suomiensis]|uniref:uncharacterized protein n=1 Tax=Kockiozyma suomiensis TaxID=1337062 RepID=UPI0033436CC7
MQFKVVLLALAAAAGVSAVTNATTNGTSTTNTSVPTSATPSATESVAAGSQNIVGAGILGAVVAGGIALVL